MGNRSVLCDFEADKSYRFKYSSTRTKIAILQELTIKAGSDEDDVLIIMKDPVTLGAIEELVKSTTTLTGIRTAACELLGSLGHSTVPVPSELTPCIQLVSLLRCVVIFFPSV